MYRIPRAQKRTGWAETDPSLAAWSRGRDAGGPRPYLLVPGLLTELLPECAPAGLSCDYGGRFFLPRAWKFLSSNVFLSRRVHAPGAQRLRPGTAGGFQGLR